jgi:hypothetical protein
MNMLGVPKYTVNNGCVTPGRPAHGVEASSSRVALSTSGGPTASPERERERVDALPAHFAEAQDEQNLWQELRDHDASVTTPDFR